MVTSFTGALTQKDLTKSTATLRSFSPGRPYMDDFGAFQNLMKHSAEALQVPLEEIYKPQHSLVDILHTSSQGKIALDIIEALLSPAYMVWQTPATIPPTCKKVDKYCVQAKSLKYTTTSI
ncbi:anoctamin-4 [Platysternon megacephalum]|uniref:Anoctamin-4 n=1 Tax=Platysternon megacephalum TaxID=55544 RepID=A0A4D9EAX6_9SAUR|nr:anoctamin-4 [Platysternon megacephalum]